MDFLQLARDRFSCRKFENKTVEKEKIDMILSAALVSPTAVNRQPQRILVVDDNELLTKLKDATKYTFDAPVCFVICVDRELAYSRGYDGKNSAEIDGSIVTTHMMLEAQDLGLGTTWVMAFNPIKVREILEIPDNLEPLALMPTGYPADDVQISPMHSKSISLDEMVSYNKF
ncbi:MAG: nitroreductase family protein [Eubacterium sp.]